MNTVNHIPKGASAMPVAAGNKAENLSEAISDISSVTQHVFEICKNIGLICGGDDRNEQEKMREQNLVNLLEDGPGRIRSECDLVHSILEEINVALK